MPSFWSGTAAGCAFVVVTLIGRAVDAVPTLPELIQDRLILLLPGSVFSFLLDRLLYLGKPLLFTALLLGQILLGGLVGIAIGRWGRPVATSAGLWLATGILLEPVAERGVFAGSLSVALVTLLAFTAYALTFARFAGLPVLPGWWSAGATPAGLPDVLLDRRRLLGGGVLVVAVAVLARRAIGKLPARPPRGRDAAAGGGTQALPAPGASLEAPVPGLPPPVTPADRFYIVSKNLLDPELDAGDWRLRVDGLVAHPLDVRYSDLLALPAVTVYRTLECVSNEVGGDLISNGEWTGVRLADLLERAGVQPGASALFFTSADRYTADMPLGQALDPETLLVYSLNGGPLPDKHGFPARILATGTYGMKNPKWLTRIEVVKSPRAGFWQQQGWDEEGIVQTMARIDTPEDGARVPAGVATIAGITFAGARGVTRIEVSTDGGKTWQDTQLLPSLGPNTWTFWQHPWQPPQPGTYTVVARATDGTGTVQTARETDPFPAGATGYHKIRVRVVS